MTVDELKRGEGWTPGRIWMARMELGENGQPLPREDFAAAVYTTARSLVRWEWGERKPMPSAVRLMVDYLKEALGHDAWTAIAAFEGEPELREAYKTRRAEKAAG